MLRAEVRFHAAVGLGGVTSAAPGAVDRIVIVEERAGVEG
jgi:hypothetical protein